MATTPAERVRVAVTGIGTVSNAGAGHRAFWQSLLRDADEPVGDGIAGFDPSPWFQPNEAKRSDPYIVYAVVAAELALDDAGRPSMASEGSGVVMGNLYGAAGSLEAQQAVLAERGAAAVSPVLCAISCEDACASALSIRFGCRGPSKLVVTSCASGTTAVAEGAALVAAGTCDTVLAGATLGPLTDVIKTSYENLRVVSPSGWVRPFDERRDGFAFAEGAAVLVLESWQRAIGRGASIYGEIAGWAMTNDAFHFSKPSGEGVERSMRLALDHAGIATSDIAHVNAHGTGTRTGDAEEAAAVRRVFGDPGPAMTSIKGATGHALAAAGAFEAASVLLSFRHRLIPATGIEVEPDPAISNDIVTGAARPWRPGPAISNSFGLGGHNTTIVLLPPNRA